MRCDDSVKAGHRRSLSQLPDTADGGEEQLSYIISLHVVAALKPKKVYGWL